MANQKKVLIDTNILVGILRGEDYFVRVVFNEIGLINTLSTFVVFEQSDRRLATPTVQKI